jgi:hypothetical protein
MLHLVILFLYVSVINAQVSDDVLCEGRVFEPSCTTGTIRVVSASYGKSDSWFCGGRDARSWSTNCASDVTSNVRTACQGKTTCSVRVDGQDQCAGFAKYLQVVWACDTGIVQTRSNNKNTNIVFSTAPTRATPLPLHGQVVRGNLYIFVDPPRSISQVRWYLDAMDRVYTTETAAPWDLLGGRVWDTVASRVTEGDHRIGAAITFTDDTTGFVDATFTVRNGAQAAVAARAVEKASTPFLENSTAPALTVEEPHVVPWSLFGGTCGVVIILVVALIFVNRKTASVERA